ncbi:MAG: DUF11 domain-containing protein [Anaerolineae bacterium]|nr:DUF11 domain-containing protein [Anaerolineae bacterium]
MRVVQPSIKLAKLTVTVVLGLTTVCAFLLLLAGLASPILAAPLPITVSGPISSDTVWTPAGNPYTITGIVQVQAVLTIQPGVVVSFANGAQLVVESSGRLHAEGSAAQPIRFTAQNPGVCAWEGLDLKSNNNVLRYAWLEYAKQAVKFEFSSNLNTIEFNTFQHNGGCFADPTSGAIIGATDRTIISQNVFTDNQTAIYLSRSSVNRIEENVISGTTQNGVFFGPTLGTPSQDNLILSNTIRYAGGYGIYMATGNVNWIQTNQIYNNTAGGIRFEDQTLFGYIRYNDIYNNAGPGLSLTVITATSSALQPDLFVVENVLVRNQGGGILWGPNNSVSGTYRFLGNVICQNTPYSFRNTDTFSISVTPDWWGANSPTFGPIGSGADIQGSVNIDPRLIFTATPVITWLPADGVSTTVVTVSLQGGGATVPARTRVVSLTTSLGTLSANQVTLDANGLAAVTLQAATTVGTALITATEFCGYPVTTTVAFLPTDLAVSKSTALTEVVPGQTITYTVEYSNNTMVPAANVALTDTLPANVTWLTDTAEALGFTRLVNGQNVVWSRASLGGNAVGSITLVGRLPQTAIAGCGQTLTNSVIITTTTLESDSTNNSATDGGGIQVICANVGLAKSSTLTQVLPGQTVTYTIAYSNSGDAPAQNVVITDTLPGNVSWLADDALAQGFSRPQTTPTVVWTRPSLAANTNGAITLVGQTNPAIGCGVTLNNRVVITSATPDENVGNRQAGHNGITTVCADVTLNKTGPGGNVVAGSTITYTLDYTNAGTAPAANVTITDVHPLTGGIDLLLSGVTLNPGQNGSLAYPVWIDPVVCGTNPTVSITNTGYIRTITPESNFGNNASSVARVVECASDLVITKTRISSAASLGQVITFTIEYANTGVFTAPGAVITDLLSADVNYVTDTFATGPPITTTGTVAWNLGDLAPGASGSFDVGLRYDPGSCFGTTSFTNTVQIGAPWPDANPGNNVDTEGSGSISCSPDLVVTKNDGVGGPPPQRPEVLAGDLITYTITYVNVGGEPAHSVVLTETLPAHTIFVGPPGWHQVGASSLYTYNLNTVGASIGGSRSFVVRVIPTLPGDVSVVYNEVRIGGAETDAYPADNVSYENTPVRAVTDLAIEKTGLTPLAFPGDPVSYAITVTNQGSITATNVLITDTLPASATYQSNTVISAPVSTTTNTVIWDVEQIDPGQTLNFSLTLQTDSDSGICAQTYLLNTIEVRGDTMELDYANNTAATTPANSPVIACRDLVITKTIQNVAPSYGKVSTFTVTYRNAGLEPMANVVITDFLDGNVEYVSGAMTTTGLVTWNLGVLPSGASGSFEVGIRPLTCLTGSVSFTNAVGIGSTTVEPYLINNYSQAGPVSIPCGQVDLVVVKNDNVGGPSLPFVYAGDLITYTISYVNAGDATATGVVITETLPDYTDFVGPAGSNGWFQVGSARQYRYYPGVTSGTLTAKEGDKLQFVVRVTSTLPGSITLLENRLEIGGNQPDAEPADNESIEWTPVRAVPDLRVEKVALTPVARPGQQLTYLITVTNQGLGSANNVVLTDTLPAGTIYVTDTLPFPHNGSGSGPISWNIGALSPITGSRNFSLTLLAGPSVCLGNSAINTLEAGANEPDANPANNTTTAISAVGCRDVAIEKSAGLPQINPDRDIAFTLVYRNLGAVTATNTIITDALPLDISFGQSAPVYSSAAGNVYQWNVGDLPPNMTGAIVITGHVAAAATCDSILTNTAAVTAGFVSGADQYPGNNQAAAAVTVRCIPDLVVAKNDRMGGPGEPPFVQPGEVFTYSILYNNIGRGTAHNVVLTETLPAYTAFRGPAGASGWFQVGASREYTYSLGDVASGSGFQVEFAVQVTNTLPPGMIGNFITNTVCLGSPDEEITLTNNCSFEQSLVTSNLPRLNIAKAASPAAGATVEPGQPITYTVVVFNDGQAEAQNVAITDTLPTAVTFVTATLSSGQPISGPNPLSVSGLTLPVNSAVTMTIVVNVNNVVSGAIFTNTAETVSISSTLQTSGPVTHVVATLPLAISKQANPAGGSMVNPGDLITYTVRVTNTSAVAQATHVFISDGLPLSTTLVGSATGQGSITGTNPVVVDVGSLGPGAGVVFTATMQVNGAAISGTVLTNYATVWSAQTSPTPTNVVTHLVASSLLSAVKTASPVGGSVVQPGSLITYTIRVTNTGLAPLTGLVITDFVPISATFVSSATGQGSIGGPDPLVAALGTLNNGQSAGFTFTVRVDGAVGSGTVITNLARIDSDQTAPISTNIVAHPVLLTPSLVISKTALPVGGSAVQAGQAITYTVVVLNNGAATANNVLITDTLPLTEVSFVTATLSNGGPINGPNPLSVGALTLPVNSAITMTVMVTVNNVVTGTIFTNTAETMADTLPVQSSLPVTHIVTPTIPSPDLAVSKTALATIATVGDQVIYAITVTNHGNLTATNVIITDTLPTGTYYVTNTIIGLPVITNTNPLTWNIGPVAPAQTVAFTLTLDTDSFACLVHPLTNRVEAFGLEPESNTANNAAVVNLPDLICDDVAISKLVNTGLTSPNQDVVFTLTYTNNNILTATNVVVTDTLPADIVFVSSTPPPSGSVGSAYRWPIGSLPGATAGTIVITGHVSAAGCNSVLTNTAEITTASTDANLLNNIAAATVQVVCGVDLAVYKNDGVGGPAEPPFVQPGDVITYSLPYLNLGTGDAINAVLTETLPDHTSFVGPSSPSGWFQVGATRDYTYSLGAVTAGSGDVITFAVRVDAIPSGSYITNAVCISSADNDVVPSNNCSFEQTLVTTNTPRLNVSKSAVPPGGSAVAPGQTITYTIVVLNNGAAPATNVLITDTLPLTEVSFITATLSSGDPLSGPNPLAATVPTLTVNSAVTMTVVVTVNNVVTGTIFTNTAQAVADTLPVQMSMPVTHVMPGLVLTTNLAITKTALATVATAGDQVTYAITVNNQSALTATNVIITDTLPFATNYVTDTSGVSPTLNLNEVTWNMGQLNPGQTVTFTLTADTDAWTCLFRPLINRIEAFAAETDTYPGNNVYTTTLPTLICDDVGISKAVNMPVTTPDRDVVFTLNYTNTGVFTATNVVITDTLPLSVSFISSTPPAFGPFGRAYQWSVGDIPAGLTGAIVITAHINAAVPCSSTLTNTAAITTTSPDEYSPNNGAAAQMQVLCGIDLSILKNDGVGGPTEPPYVQPGEVITYSLSYNNLGTGPATGVVVTETLPDHTSFVGPGGPSGWFQVGATRDYTYSVGTVMAGSGDVITFAVRVDTIPPGGFITNTVCVGSVENDVIPGNNCSFEQTLVTTNTPRLNVSKSAVPPSGSAVAPGQAITYTVVVLNNGAAPANNVVITDTLPLTEVSFITATLSSGDPLSGPNPLAATVPTLTVNSAVTMTVVVTVNNVVTGTIFTNTAQAVANTLPVQMSMPVTHVVTSTIPVVPTPTLVITKTAAPPGGSQVEPGDPITYTITVLNNGSGPANNVVISDLLDANVNLVTSNTVTGTLSGPNPVQVNIPTLNVGQVVTVTLGVTVTGNVSGTLISNQAGVTSTQMPLPQVSGVVTHVISSSIVVTPTFGLFKSADPPSGTPVNPGDTITYTIVVSNSGDPATNVVLADVIPAGTAYVTNSITATLGSVSFNGFQTIVNVPNFSSGASLTATFRVTVTTNFTTTLTNQALLDSDQTPITTSNVVTHPVRGTSLIHVYLPIIFLNYSGPWANLSWIAQDQDRVREVDGSDPLAFTPDSQNDGAFSLTVNTGSAGTKTVSRVQLVSSQPGAEWDTVVNTIPVLGIFNGGTRLNNNDGTIDQTITGQVVVTLYASDDGGSRFPPDTFNYTVIVTFTDGTSVMAAARIPALPPLPPAPGCDPVADIMVGNTPRGVAVDETHNRVYVANYGSNSVSVIDSGSNTVLQTIAPITAANGLAYDPTNNIIWVTSYSTDRVTPIQADANASNFTVLSPVSVGDGPWGVAVDYTPGRNYVYVVNNLGNSVTVINAGTQEIIGVVSGSFSQPFHVAVNPATGKAYVPNFGNHTVTVLNGTAVSRIISLTDGDPSTQPYGVAVDEMREIIYVATVDSHRVVAIGPKGGQPDQLLGWGAFHRGYFNPPPPHRPVPMRAIAVNPSIGSIPPNMDDGGHVWTTTATGDGSEADQSLLIPKGFVSDFHSPIGCNVHLNPTEGIAINRSLDRAYVSSGTNPGYLTVFNDPAAPPLVPFEVGDDGFSFEIFKVE